MKSIWYIKKNIFYLYWKKKKDNKSFKNSHDLIDCITNNDENVHRFALRPIRGELWREKERESKNANLIMLRDTF